MVETRLAIKVDVDTERGTRLGVPALARLLREAGAPGTFYLSLGPDNTGRALRRVFRPGFVKKVLRTNVLGTYGLHTVTNGLLWRGPMIGARCAPVLRAVADEGFEVGVHAWDHVAWQDGVDRWAPARILRELARAIDVFVSLFRRPPETAAAPGWQANARSLAAYEQLGIRYASDVRGWRPFFPRCGGRSFRVLQIPTTLPTLDELMDPRTCPDSLLDHYTARLRRDALNVMTVHAEIEGMHMQDWFRRFLERCRCRGVRFVSLVDEARRMIADPSAAAVSGLMHAPVSGRSGCLATQGA
jgi:undecaprenyl phosphate-alpha-L-ara4FN deformylase